MDASDLTVDDRIPSGRSRLHSHLFDAAGGGADLSRAVGP